MNKGIGRWIFAGILFLLPFSGFLWIKKEIDRGSYFQGRNELYENISQILAHYSRLANPDIFFQETVERIKRALIWEENPQPFISRFQEGIARFYLFSANGKRERKTGFSNDFIFASETCLDLICKIARETHTPINHKQRNLSESLFGESQALQILAREPNKLHSLESFGVPRRVGIFPFRTRSRKKYFLLAIFDTTNLSKFDLTKNALEKIRSLAGKNFSFGFIDLHREFPPQIPSPATSLPSKDGALSPAGDVLGGLEKILQAFSSAGGQPVFETDGKFWSRNTLDRRWVLFGFCKVPNPLQPFFERNLKVLAGGFLLFILLAILLRIGEKRGIPVRYQISALFFLSTMAGICTLMGFGGIYSEMRSNSLLRERLVQTRQILEKIDTSFQTFQKKIAKNYGSLLPVISNNLTNPAAIRKILGKFEKHRKNVSVRLIDFSGNILFQMDSEADVFMKNIWGSDFRKMVGKIGRLSMKVYNVKAKYGTRLKDPSIDQETVVVKRIGIVLFQHHGKLKLMQFGHYTLPMCAHYVTGPDGLAKALLWITHRENHIENLFCSRIRKIASVQFPSTFHFRILPIFRGKKTGVQTRFSPLGKTLHELNGLIGQVNSPESRVIQSDKSRILLSGIPCKDLVNYNLFLVNSLIDLDRKIGGNSRLFLGILALIILFSFSQSFVFSQMILDPVNKLLVGLEYLTQSNFQHEITLKTGDEFETLGAGVNRILEEMKELSLAKNIQEHLFPPGPLRGPLWHCFGLNQSSSEIGGEIFDFQNLEGNRMALFLGRIPGHAIGSALILAMMKMAVRLLLDTRKGSAKELLEELQNVLFSRIKGVRESHFLLGIYDGPSATMELACHGGPFLLLKGSFPSSTGDKTNFMEMETGQSAPISFSEIQLRKGEILFVFSHSVLEKSELISLFSRPEPQIGANSARNLDNDQSLTPDRSPTGKDHLELLGEELFGRLGVLVKGESLQSRTMVAFEVKSS